MQTDAREKSTNGTSLWSARWFPLARLVCLDMDKSLQEFMKGFTSSVVSVDGVGVHCVRGGSGPPMLLIHGFPQDWWEWRSMMDRLASTFEVIAVDLRGVGRSSVPDAGYDAATMATDVFGVVNQLGLGRVHVVGHDVGGWVAYAFARLFPQALHTVTVAETPLPGTHRFEDPGVDVPMWHGEFHMIPDLPETLVEDRQVPYFRYFFEVGTRADAVISDADIKHYAASYGDRERLRAAFEMYRAAGQNIDFSRSHRDPIHVPLCLIGGEHVFGPTLADTADELTTQFGWTDVTVHVIADGMHYLMEERPDDVAAILLEHASR